MRQFISIASGASFSSPFALERAERGFAVFVPSISGAAIFLQFVQTSGGPVFHDLARPDGSGATFAIHSGSGPGVGYIAACPTPWGRLRVSNPTTEPSSVLTLPRW